MMKDGEVWKMNGKAVGMILTNIHFGLSRNGFRGHGSRNIVKALEGTSGS